MMQDDDWKAAAKHYRRAAVLGAISAALGLAAALFLLIALLGAS